VSNTSGWASYMSPTIRHIVVHRVDRAEIHMFDKPQKVMLVPAALCILRDLRAMIRQCSVIAPTEKLIQDASRCTSSILLIAPRTKGKPGNPAGVWCSDLSYDIERRKAPESSIQSHVPRELCHCTLQISGNVWKKMEV